MNAIASQESGLELLDELAQHLQFEALLADLSAQFVNLTADQVDCGIEDAQRRICESLGVDHSSLWQMSHSEPGIFLLTHLYRDPGLPPAADRMDGDSYFCWAPQKIKGTEIVCVPRIADATAEAAIDKRTWQALGIKSSLAFPLSVGNGPVFGVLAFDAIRDERVWPDALVKRLQLVAHVFANALARERAEQILSESEARLRLAAASAGAGLWTLNTVTGQFWATDKNKQLLGVATAEELDLEKFLSLIHPEDRERVSFIIEEAQDSGEDIRMEYRISRPDGHMRWISTHGCRSFGGLGEPAQIMGSSVDITDHKLGDENRLSHAAVMESLDDAIISKNLEGVIVSWNGGAQRIFGYSEAEAVGRPITILVPPELRDEEISILPRLKTGMGIEHRETVGIAKDGRMVDVSLTTFPLRDSTGRIVGASEIARDITCRKRAEQDLRESEERFRLVANTAPVLIWMSGADKLCTFFNESWLHFTGRTLEDELGEGWASGVHPDDLRHCLGIYATAFDARVEFQMEYRLGRFDGQYRWVTDYGVPRFESDGMFLGYVGSCIDITDRRLSEEALLDMSGRLIAAHEEERARIARELHDDLSQRMALLQMGIEQFKQDMPRGSSQAARQLGNIARIAAEVSSDIHNLSHELHPSKLEALGLVAAVGGVCREFSKQHDLKVQFVHREIPRQISKDLALCLFRIVQESLRNVVKHSGAAEAHVELAGQHDRIDLCISDSGIGFDAESAKAKKTGLGLISMRERLRLVSGQLRVESNPSGGMRILARVPLFKTKADIAREGKVLRARA